MLVMNNPNISSTCCVHLCSIHMSGPGGLSETISSFYSAALNHLSSLSLVQNGESNTVFIHAGEAMSHR